ncbi:MAG TPA: amidase family protein [Pyrinomonadaceae bacterium]|nr:amidase family protein [Pyrinomonadaceae bacterium]
MGTAFINFDTGNANLACCDGVRRGLRAQACDDELDKYTLKRAPGLCSTLNPRIILEVCLLSFGWDDTFLRAQKVRTITSNDFKAAFKNCKVIANPVAPVPAFQLSKKTGSLLPIGLGDVFRVTTRLSGLPAIRISDGKKCSEPSLGIQFSAGNLNKDILDAFNVTGTLSPN